MSPAIQQLNEALATLRRDWRRRVMLESAVMIAGAAILAVIAGFVLTKVLGPGGSSVLAMRIIGYTAIAAAFARFFAWPLLRRTDDARALLKQVPPSDPFYQAAQERLKLLAPRKPSRRQIQ